jgi:hypothetical protein
MERSGVSTLVLSEGEGKFLLYIACRINYEVDRFRRGEQSEARTRAHVKQLADRALEILDSKDEVDAWLDTAIRARELLRASPAAE